MVLVGSSVGKKKKVSKKLKTSWRKHVNINDVEDFLEDKRLEERLGPSLSTISDDKLFQVDIGPNTELLSAKERRKLKASKPLKCFSALQPHTQVPDPIAKRNRVRTKEERKNQLVKLKETHNRANGIFKRKEIEANANRQLNDIRKKIHQPKRGDFSFDLWEDEGKQFAIEKDEWARTDTKKHNLRGVGIPVKKCIASISEKKSPLPAIESPHPGMSYNPSLKDHQDLLQIVAEKELEWIKTDSHLTRCTKGMFSKVSTDKKNKDWIIEMSEGLPSTAGTNVSENEASSDEYTAVNPPVQNKKKSLKQKRNQKEQKQLEKQRRALKLEKKKITDIHRLKAINEELLKIENKQKVLREKRKKKEELKKKETKILGPVKYEDPDFEFHMAQEISGNLRNLKMQGNLLMDRFKSLQKRNVIAPSKKHLPKKAKVKKFTKPGHKDEDWKKTVAGNFK
nr:unnamed protein product [Callosobruchus analis]